MPTFKWQKSSRSSEASNCVELAADDASGPLHIRESDAPDVVLRVDAGALRGLLRAVKGGLPV
ncbi:DUF397 domain-containing protein [Streptomyces sp. N2-109]|uniref:DUF397 domain-containing protein n=1 Tax=Streptomyces gossypii TaxID=2883101 RepID=A0ABT2JTS1_9ACTN|nr:DUF397 domain-containing protein [Streptomyces gossypii]MCT2591270.1 DUF397 domain-containing protein [Streptomyces gossypii]